MNLELELENRTRTWHNNHTRSRPHRCSNTSSQFDYGRTAGGLKCWIRILLVYWFVRQTPPRRNRKKRRTRGHLNRIGNCLTGSTGGLFRIFRAWPVDELIYCISLHKFVIRCTSRIFIWSFTDKPLTLLSLPGTVRNKRSWSCHSFAKISCKLTFIFLVIVLFDGCQLLLILT